jgi:hypothetical protein
MTHLKPNTKILDVQQRTPGGRFAFTIQPQINLTHALHNGTKSDVFDLGVWEWLQIIVDINATSVTDAGDVLDVAVYLSTTEAFTVGMNVAQMTQQAGDGVAKKEAIWLIPQVQNANPDAIFVAADAATVVSQCQFGRYLRLAYTLVDNGSNANDIHQIKVTGYIK